MDSKDSSVEKRLSREDEPESMLGAEASVRAMIELVHPLVRDGHKPTELDIATDIMLPVEHCRWRERDEIEKLCAVFSVMLEQLGNAILATLAIYLATLDDENTLSYFVDAIKQMSTAVPKAYDTSLIEAFRIGLLREFYYELF
jgi:hypothetical protein